ncbi:MAG: phosphoenolpyruvate--protein phosphotransferase [Acholeplasmataceae bacterium]
MIKLTGKKTGEGTAIGSAFHLKTTNNIILDTKVSNIDDEINKLESSFKKAINELETLIKTLDNQDSKEIFYSQQMMLKDPILIDLTTSKIKEGYNAVFSFNYAISEIKKMFLSSNNDYINERITDINDITNLVINILRNETFKNIELSKDTILITEELTPQMTANLDLKHVKGIITKKGSITSHAAIISKHLDIPSIANIEINNIKENDLIIIDNHNEEVIINPNNITLNKYKDKLLKIKEEKETLLKFKNKDAYTKDNKEINLFVNISNHDDLHNSLKYNPKGIGLYRTEHQFLGKTNLPTIDNLSKNYEEILSTYQNLPVIIRVLDIGGDKPLSFIKNENELNPFLGLRGIRLLLSNQELFILQLKALFKANKHNNLKILLPMVSTIEELKESLKIIKDTFNEEKIKYPFYNMPKVGIMIEVLSSALFIDKFLPLIDFISVGTNDLIQYLFAADRTNENVSYLYEPYHPVLLKVLKHIIDEGEKHQKEVSVCGELASDPLGSLILVGLGLKNLSMNYNHLLVMKKNLSNISLSDLVNLSNQALNLNNSKEVKELFNKNLNLFN